jgi:MoaA/NifB/PqqE/SkfB family radical SAM enzyme
MHVAEVDLAVTDTDPASVGLSFLWLELTNRCNLQCVHCYTESNPWTGDRDVLTADDYESVMRQAYALGCRRLQFIGGEPQLNRDFLRLLTSAKEIGFEFIEVFSNLTMLDEATVRFAADAHVCFATSVYSDQAAEHNAITGVGSSHARTIKNLKRLIASGIRTRAAVIQIDQLRGTVDRTKRFLSDLGVDQVRNSEVRGFGRGETLVGESGMSGLCGHCWAGKLCVAPDGAAYACVMAREWPAGNVLESSLADIVGGSSLAGTRTEVFETIWQPRLAAWTRSQAPRSSDEPYEDEPSEPETPADEPGVCSPECGPGSCPQSCEPDTFMPSCPQSCDPFEAVCVPTEGQPE